MLRYQKSSKGLTWPIFALIAIAFAAFTMIFHPAVAAAITVAHGHTFELGTLGLAAGVLFPLSESQPFIHIGRVKYACASAVTASTPIYVSGIGAMVPIASYGAGVSGEYWIKSRFFGVIASGVTINTFDTCYYVTATGKITNVDPGTGGFILGTAVEFSPSGAQVLVEVNSFAPGVLGNYAVSTTGALSAGAAKVTSLNSTGGPIAQTKAIAAYNVTGSVAAADVYGGILTSTTAAAVSLTLPAASAIKALVANCQVGTTISLRVKNTGATNAITVVLPASITNGGVSGDLSIAAGAGASYDIVFTNVTAGSEAATLIKM